VTRGMAEMELVADRDTEEGASPVSDPPDGPEQAPRRRRTLRSDLAGVVGTTARRGRLAVLVVVLAVVVAAPLLARSGVSDARDEVRAQGAERSGAAEARAAVEAQEEVATAQEATATERAAQARAARNEQRHRLAALGLNEETIDAFLVEVTANAELVEFRRDRTAADVDRQAVEIPQMQECVRVAERALNAAWNSATFGDAPPPAPTELCRALLAAGS
jgi:hypothetical protein